MANHGSVRVAAAALLALVSLLAACDAGERILVVGGNGWLSVAAFIDADGGRELSSGDRAVEGVRVALVRGGVDTVATAVTNMEGVAHFAAIPVGNYIAAIDPDILGDSLSVRDAPTRVTVVRDDTVRIAHLLLFPALSVHSSRSAPAGRTVVIEAVALHSVGIFGDSSLYVADGTASVRISGVPVSTSVNAGDSVRVVGRAGTRQGQPVLTNPTITRLPGGTVPDPRPASTADAASAVGGALDGSLVEIVEAEVVTVSQVPAGDLHFTLDDGSGPVVVVLARSANIVSPQPITPGARARVAGILVATGNGAWTLKPRASGDLNVTVPVLSIADARRRDSGRVVAISGVATSGRATFGDGIVHLRDSTASIRVAGISNPFVFPGDSLHVVGHIAIRDGQRTVTALQTSVLGRVALPSPIAVTTGTAATADGGQSDAALVRVVAAEVRDTATVGSGDLEITLDDGSGPLTMVLDRGSGISASGLTPGASIDATGLLVPRGVRWILKPRNREDLLW